MKITEKYGRNIHHWFVACTSISMKIDEYNMYYHNFRLICQSFWYINPFVAGVI